MKKIIIPTIIGILVLAFAVSMVFAGPGPIGFMPFNGYQGALTDAQRQELAPLYNQMFEIRKQLIQKQVEFGNLTQEQANERIEWMNRRSELGFGPGAGRGPGGGPGFRGQGGPCWR